MGVLEEIGVFEVRFRDQRRQPRYLLELMPRASGYRSFFARFCKSEPAHKLKSPRLPRQNTDHRPITVPPLTQAIVCDASQGSIVRVIVSPPGPGLAPTGFRPHRATNRRFVTWTEGASSASLPRSHHGFGSSRACSGSPPRPSPARRDRPGPARQHRQPGWRRTKSPPVTLLVPTSLPPAVCSVRSGPRSTCLARLS